MGRLFGKVLVKETNAGIPNLVVAAFDQDPAARGDAAAVDHRRDHQGVEGVRLGSVLTGPGGDFELDYESWTRGRPGSEIRPDLVIAVFAPEDSLGLKDPHPRLPEQRLLHISRVPRIDASSIEAYVIRILRAQLEEIGSPFPSGVAHRDPRVAADFLVGPIERSWAIRDLVRERLKPRLDREAKKAEERRKKAKAWARGLSLSPSHLRESPFFAKDEDEAAKAHERAIKEGLAALKDYKPRLRLKLDPESLSALGLRMVDDKLEGKVSLAKLKERAFAESGGPDLVRQRDLQSTVTTPARRLKEVKERVNAEKARLAAASAAREKDSAGGPQ